MRNSILFLMVVIICSCHSSSKKNPNQVMDDTARMRDKPVNPVTVAVKEITGSDLDEKIEFKGDLQKAWKWNDLSGDNILILSKLKPYADPDKETGEEALSATLYATHLIKKENGYIINWTITDTEKSCPFDITCDFISEATSFTDMDQDGMTEIKFLYTKACRSDVSPSMMKLILTENKEKYSLEGNRWMAIEPGMKCDVTEANADLSLQPVLKDEYQEIIRSFGRYRDAKDFENASPEFLTFARREWVRYIIEKTGE